MSKVNSSVIYVKATCQASVNFKQWQTTYTTCCQCSVGLAQTCSHVGALLFALSHAKPKESATCTSQPCTWIIPARQVKPTGPMSTFPKKKSKNQVEETENHDPLAYYDPRHSDDRQVDMNYTLQQLRDFRDLFPQTGMSHLWNIPDHAPEAILEMEVHDVEDTMVTKTRSLIFCEGNEPHLTIDQNLVEFIEKCTRGQRTSDMWQKLHIGRLTSSIFGDVLKAPNSLFKQISQGSSLKKYAALPPAVQWGQDKEAQAWSDYVSLKSAINSNFKVEDTGLTLCSEHSFLGASSDGKILDGDSTGLLVIKCPYSIQGTEVTTKEVGEIAAMVCPNFCLEESLNGPHLKKSHKFYAQVQGEMAIKGLPWCVFVVGTNAT